MNLAEKHLKLLCGMAALVMLLPLPIMQYVGEESYYTLSAYEMVARGEYWHQSILGLDWPKTPLYNWLIIAISEVIGWSHMDFAARFISVLSTWGSAAVVWFMARRFFANNTLAPWLAATVYLTMGEISFWYGWLGYADATFGFFIFASIAGLWIAIEKEHLGWLAFSALMISLAFLTKNISCYAFYGASGLILLHRLQRWRLLRSPAFMLVGLSALLPLWLYQHFAIHSEGSNSTVAINDALRFFEGYSPLDYLKHWLTYPFLFLGRAFPVTVLIAWFYFKHKSRFTLQHELVTTGMILIACILPFWLPATSTPRYLVPFYGLLALILTGLLLQTNRQQLITAIKVLSIMVILKIPYSLGILPYIKDWRPERDLKAIAEQVHTLTQNHPLRSVDDVSTGLSLAAYLDPRRNKDEYIRWYNGKETKIYILCDYPDPNLGEVVAHYRIRGDELYVYWKP